MMQGGPQMHTIAAKAVNFKECATPEYADYTRRVIENSKALAQGLADRGIRPTTGGTDTHLSLLDLQGVEVVLKLCEPECKGVIHWSVRSGLVGLNIRISACGVQRYTAFSGWSTWHTCQCSLALPSRYSRILGRIVFAAYTTKFST